MTVPDNPTYQDTEIDRLADAELARRNAPPFRPNPDLITCRCHYGRRYDQAHPRRVHWWQIWRNR